MVLLPEQLLLVIFKPRVAELSTASATYVYNGTTNQVTGNGLPIAVQVLSISSFGPIGNNTVTAYNIQYNG
jgi:hypothetical protein